MNKHKYVLAANYQHFLYYCRHVAKFNPRDAVYVARPESLWGITKEEVDFIFYETWMEHPDAWEMFREVQMILARPNPVPPKSESKMEQNETFWYRLTKLDPAVFRGLVVATVTLLASLGVFISPAVPDGLVGFFAVAATVAQALWTRPAVTANARVAVLVPDPVNNPQIVEAGEAIATASDAEIISAATENPKP